MEKRHWEEFNKLQLTIKEEPTNIYTSNDLTFMVVCFEKKFVVYKLNEKYESLVKINVIKHKVLSGFIYENCIFLFSTENGIYYCLLNDENTYPSKLFRQSDEFNLYNLKVSKKHRENKIFFDKKLKQLNILGVFGTHILTSDINGNIEVSELNNILFNVISLIKSKNY